MYYVFYIFFLQSINKFCITLLRKVGWQETSIISRHVRKPRTLTTPPFADNMDEKVFFFLLLFAEFYVVQTNLGMLFPKFSDYGVGHQDPLKTLDPDLFIALD